VTRAVALAVVLAQAPLSPGCADRAAALHELGRARVSEIEQAEDVHWEALRQALARCRKAPDRSGCERARRREAETGFARTRAAIEATYERLAGELEARCHAPLAGAGVRRG
jgi:hypothetical protein